MNEVNITRCEHCGNVAPLKPEARTERRLDYGDDPRYQDHDYYTWHLFVCPVCDKPTLVEIFRTTFEQNPNEGWPAHTRVLYPPEAGNTEGLPGDIQKAYLAALKVRNIDPNAFAVLLGRVLDLVCVDHAAVGDNLYTRLDDLAQRSEIPGRLAQMAHNVRILRNFGAHADMGEVEPRDVPVLLQFCEAILEYLYRAPQKLEAIQHRIEQLKSGNGPRE